MVMGYSSECIEKKLLEQNLMLTKNETWITGVSDRPVEIIKSIQHFRSSPFGSATCLINSFLRPA